MIRFRRSVPVLRRLALAAVLLLPVPAAADTAAWDALRAPGAIVVMRHARAPGTGDPPGFALGDCATQRDLDAAGRAQAKAIGDAFRRRGIAVDRVLSSRWCRCLHTAEETGLAPVEPFPPLDSFFADRASGAARTRAVIDFLAEADSAQRLLLVTHQVNVTALTGVFPASGEAVVVRVGADRRVEVLGRIRFPVPPEGAGGPAAAAG